MPVPSEILNNLVDVGNVANDGSGDDLREAFIKINENIIYVAGRIGTAVGGTNIGSVGEPVLKEVVDAEFHLRKINATGNLHISTVNDVITVEFKPNSDVDFLGHNITNAGTVTATGFSGPLTGTVTGDVTGNVTGNAGTVTNGVYTTGTYNNPSWITGLAGSKISGNITASLTGNVTGNVTGQIRTTTSNAYVDVSELESRINIFDYGVINPVFTDPVRYTLYAIGTDMGTFNNPSEFGIDAGTINGD